MFARWGGKRALALRLATPVRVLSTAHRRFVQPVTAPVARLVFVCNGNICRSPFGEHLARRAGVSAFSMGLGASTGAEANARAVEHARARGIDLSPHRSLRLDAALIGPGDLVLGFELAHVIALERMLHPLDPTLRLLGAFSGPARYHIHDPYGLADEYFVQCFSDIERSVDAALRSLALTTHAHADSRS